MSTATLERDDAPPASGAHVKTTTNRPQATGPVRLSKSLRLLLATQFTADELRHLAGLMEADTPGMRARRRLSAASVEELAVMLTSGRRPTAGWWRRAS